MCGIAGYFGRPPAREDDLLRRMIGAIAHRGPDERGIHVANAAGVAHARLSIIDLSSGQQPMASADGMLWLTFNGEIFNYVELREEMIARGRTFRTSSDTEVILQLYDELGEACVDRMNGDFAFAIYDGRRDSLFLARDRMGVRPLFYAERDGCLYFGSEVKALLEAPGMTAELDPVALDQIFTFWFPLAPRTAFRDVRELPPAHTLTVTRHRKPALRRYWSLSYPDADDPGAWDRRDEREIAEELRALLTDAARIRLRSDMPVGSYLSGGLDSSVVTAIAKDLVPGRLSTFSVTFDAPEYDESREQAEMVAALGTEHRSVRVSAADIADAFPAVIGATERPILRTAPAPLFTLSKLVRDSGFKVVLTGEGADEVFGGYDIFKEAKVRRFLSRQPESRIRPLLLQRLYPYLPRLQSQSPAFLRSFFGQDAGATADSLYSHLPRFRTTAGAKVFFSGDVRREVHGYDALAEMRESLPAAFARWHPLNQAQYLETRFLLPGYILSSQGDRMAMAHAVEGRFPFLDHRLVEFAAKIPPRLKLRGLREKHILREATRGLVPEAINHRTKQPYRAPETLPFVAADAPGYVGAALSRGAIAGAGMFDPGAVDKLLQKCRRSGEVGFRDNMAFLGVLSTQLWQQRFTRAAADAATLPFQAA